MVEAPVSKILTEAQRRARRIQYLRRKFPYPLSAFNRDLLHQIGLNRRETEEVLAELQPLLAKTVVRCNAVRARAIDELLQSFPKIQDNFARCFGREVLPPSASTQADFASESIGIFTEDRGLAFLGAAQLFVLPPAVKPITDNQRYQMANLRRQTNLKLAKDRMFNADQAIDDGLEAILEEEQRAAIARAIHLTQLKTDFTVIARPSVLKFLEVDLRDAPKVESLCNKWQGQIAATRRTSERESFDSLTSKLPPNSRDKLLALFADVWTESP
ncbi:MAG: hypothetical protein ACTHOU_16805 [Aureliella sp.]